MSVSNADRVVRQLHHLRRRASRAVRRTVLRVPRRVACPICEWSGTAMAPDVLGVRGRLCPRCLSSERDRALALELRRRGPVPAGSRLLEVAPIGLVRDLAQRLGYEHHSVDLFSPRAEVRGDLTRLPYPDGTFHLVVCFHVLEHVPDDATAVRELARILSPTGEAVVVVPFAETYPETFEDPDTPPEDRERVYGQSDHVRIYGMDVAARWRAAGVALDEALWDERFPPDERVPARIAGRDDRFFLLHPPA